MQDFKALIHRMTSGPAKTLLAEPRARANPSNSRRDTDQQRAGIFGSLPLLHSQTDSFHKVVRYLGLQWNIDEHKRKEEEMGARKTSGRRS